MIKTVALAFFVLTSLALGGLLLQERHRAILQAAQVADLQTQVARQREEIQKGTAAAVQLEQKHAQLVARNKATKQALADAQTAAAATPAVAAASPTPGTGDDKKKKGSNPFADSITKMMKDPAMKNMMRTTQATALKQMYGDLVKQWSLSPEETQTFYDLLLDKQMDQMDQGMTLLEKGPDADKAVAVSDPDAKIKASLGDTLYKQYQDYEKTVAGRFTVNQFQQQLAVSNTPALTPDQSAALLQAVTEEKINMPPGTFGQPSPGAGGGAFSMTPEQVDQFVNSQSDLNARIDTRMASMFTADQMRVFKEQQQQMLAMQRMGMEMATKMMGPAPTP